MADKYVLTTFQFRRGLAENWTKNNPVLAQGEPGFERDTYKLKIGDGVTAWKDLAYFAGSGTSETDNVTIEVVNGKASLRGFEAAEAGSFAVKNVDGTLSWTKEIALRRDNDYSYDAGFIPAKGEVCFVDTAKNGLRAKVGDGVTLFTNLHFIDDDIRQNMVISGYLKDGKLYTNADYSEEIALSENTFVIDKSKSRVYVVNEDKEIISLDGSELPVASADKAGIIKLYQTVGQNTDGVMSQKATTDELNKKVEASVDLTDELLVLSTNN